MRTFAGAILVLLAFVAGSHAASGRTTSELEVNMNLLKAADVPTDRQAVLASIMKLAANAGQAYLSAQRSQQGSARRSAQEQGSELPTGDDSSMPETSTASLGRRFLSEGSLVPTGDDSAMPEGSVQAVRRSALGMGDAEQEAVDGGLLHEKDERVHDSIKTVVRKLEKLRRHLAADDK